MGEERANRFNVQLDDEHALKLHRVAERTYVQPGTIARSLLDRPRSGRSRRHHDHGVARLDSGAWERAQQGLADLEAGRVVPLDEL